MEKKRNPVSVKREEDPAEELDALNAQLRRKVDARRLIEGSIEAKAKKRRNQEKPASSAWTGS